jgi:hypothetical protein
VNGRDLVCAGLSESARSSISRYSEGALKGLLNLSSKSLKRAPSLLNIRLQAPLIRDLDRQPRKIPQMVRCHLHLGEKQLAPSIGPMVSNLNFCRHPPSLVPALKSGTVRTDASSWLSRAKSMMPSIR